MAFRLVVWLLLLLGRIFNVSCLPRTPFVNVTQNSPQCVDSPSWSSTFFTPKDCRFAIHTLYEFEVLTNARITFEFLARGATGTTVAVKQKTPRRYVAGTCTLAIVLIKDVPLVASVASRSSDLADYWSIWKLSKAISTDCLSPYLYTEGIVNASVGDTPVTFRSATGWANLVTYSLNHLKSLLIRGTLQGFDSGYASQVHNIS